MPRRCLADVVPALRKQGWRIAPLVIVRHGCRVANIGDAIAGSARRHLRRRSDRRTSRPVGARQHGRLFDLATRSAQTTDADRNCISNIRPEPVSAMPTPRFKLTPSASGRHARPRRCSGVGLKDMFGPAAAWGYVRPLNEPSKGLAPRAGIEPATFRLTVERSTAELPGNNTAIFSNGPITKRNRFANPETRCADFSGKSLHFHNKELEAAPGIEPGCKDLQSSA